MNLTRGSLSKKSLADDWVSLQQHKLVFIVRMDCDWQDREARAMTYWRVSSNPDYEILAWPPQSLHSRNKFLHGSKKKKCYQNDAHSTCNANPCPPVSGSVLQRKAKVADRERLRGVTTLTNAVSGQSQNCSGNLEISPGIGTLGKFSGKHAIISGHCRKKPGHREILFHVFIQNSGGWSKFPGRLKWRPSIAQAAFVRVVTPVKIFITRNTRIPFQKLICTIYMLFLTCEKSLYSQSEWRTAVSHVDV